MNILKNLSYDGTTFLLERRCFEVTEELHSIAEFLPTSKVTTLCVRGCNFDGKASLYDLISTLPQSKVTYLELTDSIKGKGTVEKLLQILPRTKITTLILKYNALYTRDTSALAECLPRTKIQTLDLTDCDLSIEGMRVLVSVLERTQVTNIEIYGREGQFYIPLRKEILRIVAENRSNANNLTPRIKNITI